MKKLILLILFLVYFNGYAQGPPPPPPCPVPPCMPIPLDGEIWLLIVAGILFAVNRIYKNTNEKN